MARNPAARTYQAADILQAWLDERGAVRPSMHPLVTGAPGGERAVKEGEEREQARGGAACQHEAARPDPEDRRSALAHAQTDWLFHHLQIEGPAAQVSAFRTAASGAGVIPWHLDLDRIEEDAFLRLAAPKGQARTLSLDGARMLAAELRDAVARRHALAVARVGRSQACCFDLHSLVPMPGEILRLGPDHPDALLWLWTHWGTTDALRHVALVPAAAASSFRVIFWSADWTPWRALAAIAARWPALRFEVKPRYELA